MAPQLRIVGAAASALVLGLAAPARASHLEPLAALLTPYPNCAYGNDYSGTGNFDSRLDGRLVDGSGYGYDYLGSYEHNPKIDGEAEWTFFGDAHPACLPAPTPTPTPTPTPVAVDVVPAPPRYPPPFESPPPPAPLEPPMPVADTPTPTPTPSDTPTPTPSDTPSATPSNNGYDNGYQTPDGVDVCICTIEDYNQYVGVMTAAQALGSYGFIVSPSSLTSGELYGLNLKTDAMCACQGAPVATPTESSPDAVPESSPTVPESSPVEEEEEAEEPNDDTASSVTASFIMSAEDLLKTDLGAMASEAAAAALANLPEGSTVTATPVVVVKTDVTTNDPNANSEALAGSLSESMGIDAAALAAGVVVSVAKNGVVEYDSSADTAVPARRLLQESNTFALQAIYPVAMKEAAAAASAVDLSGLCTSSATVVCEVAPIVMAMEVRMEIMSSGDLGGLGDALGDFSTDFAADNGITLEMEEIVVVSETPDVVAPTPVVEDDDTAPTPVVEDDDWFKVPKGGKDVPVGAIAGGVIGGLVLVGVAAFFIIKRKNDN